MAAPRVAPEIREICARIVEHAGAAWALEERATQAACHRLWGLAEQLQAPLRGTELEALAAELLASLDASSESEARAGFARAGELLCELERRLAGTHELPGTSARPRSGRDNETVELIADFLAESLEGLDRVDELLLAAEQESADPERVNALFRVFHTIKGVEVDDVVTQQQVVIKPLSEGVGNSDLLSGAAILSDGRVGLILNTDRIVELFGTHENGRRAQPEAAE